MASTESLPFSFVPAPWKAKGTMFVLLHKSPTDFAGAGGYPPLEEPTFTDTKASGSFVPNSLGSVMLVRYSEGTGGAYDELLFIPGSVTVPPLSTDGKKAPQRLRITNIYVSSLTSVYSGRTNWNIPKHHAHFRFSPENFDNDPSCKSVSIEVRHDETDTTPFFKAEFNTIPWHPTIPGFLLNTKNIPKSLYDLTMWTPPLPESPNWKENGEAGTDKWQSFDGSMNAKGGVKAVWVKPRLGLEKMEGEKQGEEIARFGDGKSFPDVELWKYGFWWKDVDFGFPEAVDIETTKHGKGEGESKKTK